MPYFMTHGILDSSEAASMVPPNFMTHRALDSREAASTILRRIGILSLGKFSASCEAARS